MQRYLESFIYRDLLQKMVFIGGPRQVGKKLLWEKHYAMMHLQMAFI